MTVDRDGRTILVVEDDPAIRRLVSTLLKREGYEVDEAPHGGVAIEKLRERPYYAVILDLMMPVVSGFEVIDYMKQIDPARRDVIVMTAAGHRGTSQLDTSIVYTVLEKPFEMASFHEALETYGRAAEKERCRE